MQKAGLLGLSVTDQYFCEICFGFALHFQMKCKLSVYDELGFVFVCLFLFTNTLVSNVKEGPAMVV